MSGEEMLKAMGFGEDAIRGALGVTKGNVQEAAQMLLDQQESWKGR